MAELTLRLLVDQKTGKKNIVVSYRSDEDALPMEHEEEHRRWLEAVLEAAGVREDELGQILVEREGSNQPIAVDLERGEPQAEALKERG